MDHLALAALIGGVLAGLGLARVLWERREALRYPIHVASHAIEAELGPTGDAEVRTTYVLLTKSKGVAQWLRPIHVDGTLKQIEFQCSDRMLQVVGPLGRGYTLQFDRPLDRGGMYEITQRMTVASAFSSTVEFYGVRVQSPTGTLEVSLRFPEARLPRWVAASHGAEGMLVDVSSRLQQEPPRRYRLRLTNLVPATVVLIRWEW